MTRRFKIFITSLLLLTSACGDGLTVDMKHAKRIRPRQRFTVQHSAGELLLIRVQTRGDGNCALYSMEKTRPEFTSALSQRIEEPGIQAMLREDLRAAGYRPATGRTDYELNDYVRYTQERLTQPREYLSFVEQVGLIGVARPNLTSPDIAPEGSLAAAAAVFNINVRVWKKSQDHTLRLVAKFINQNSGTYFDLFHEGIHFDRLVPAGDTAAFERALDWEP